MLNKFFSIIFEIVPIFASVVFFNLIFLGCSIEDSKPSKVDVNKTAESFQRISPQTAPALSLEIPQGSYNAEFLDSLLKKHLSDLIPAIGKAIPKPENFDYTRLEDSFLKMLLENRTDKNLKRYQFICDENERWIYRCNMETGEIECFSMSLNKLRLLSSIK
jgi:hypothetical protein